MKILNVEIAASYEGLSAISMKGLGDMVVLAGRNGSGKSRILRAIAAHAAAHLSFDEMATLRRDTAGNKRNIEVWLRRIEVLNAAENKHQGQLDEIAQLRTEIGRTEETISSLSKKFAMHSALEITAEGIKPVAVLYQVREPDLKDHREMRLNEISSGAAHVAESFNINLVKHYGLAALHNFISRYVFAKDLERDSLELQMQQLKSLLRDFLGAELDWDGESGARLFGMPIAEANLSDGQKVLLQVALSVFFQDGSRDDLIVLLDEPENHLHPSAVIDLVARIKTACPNAQIWISTHSIHLLAVYESSGIWFVQDGKVEFSGAGSCNVLESLLGGDEGANQLVDFLALPTRYAINSFAAQCMMPAGICDTDPSDPQTSQIAQLLRSRVVDGKRLRVMDFGMGKGRLLAALFDRATSEGVLFRDRIDYLGFDYKPSAEDERLCRKRFSLAYGSDVDSYYSGYGSLERIDSESVDVIVMCNVLHEIDPSDWLKIFGVDGVLSRIIRADGMLMIVEDQVLRVGERAHRFGFLVMDEAELRQLFGMAREDKAFKTFNHELEKYRGRLKAHEIPGMVLRAVTRDTRRDAVLQLKQTADREVREIQGEQYDRAKARAYAFWSHQYVNASLAISDL